MAADAAADTRCQNANSYGTDKFVWNVQLPIAHKKRERERLSLSAFLRTRGHQGPYSPYKPFNHNLYIGIIIFPHIDNPQSTDYN